MIRPSIKKDLLKKPRFIPLHYRFIFMTSCMLILILGTLAFILGLLQSHMIRNQLEKRGLSIAQSLGATSMANLLTYNYVALEQSAYQASQEVDIIYVIIHDKEGRVAGFSGRPELQNKYLNDSISQNAIKITEPLVQEVHLNAGKTPGIEISVPVYPSGSQIKWGTVRVCLSLVQMYSQIHQIQWIILIIGLIALAIGTLVSILTAQRITRPLDHLVKGTQEAARGNLNCDIRVETGDEIEVLASNFSTMILEIVAHREQLENQLTEIKRLQGYTDQLLMTMGDGLLSVNMEKEINTINPAAGKILNAAQKTINQGSRIEDSLNDFPELLEMIEKILKEPFDMKPREIQLRNDEDIRYNLVGASILKDRSGNPQEVILNLHDITELKKLEISIRQAERLAGLGTLAAGMAHEIRNPLSTIKTFVQLLPRKLEKPGFLDKFRRTVPRELNQINRLVEDLLELARIPKYRFEETDIRKLLDQTIDFMDEEFKKSGIRCGLEYPSEVPAIRADGSQLSKAFSNIVRNAVQAMPDGGDLVVKASYHVSSDTGRLADDRKDWLRLIFEDSGHGMTKKEQRNIFNPFFTTKDKGTGLGLAITHKVVVEHGGRIDVDSRLNEGTSIIIELPVF